MIGSFRRPGLPHVCDNHIVNRISSASVEKPCPVRLVRQPCCGGNDFGSEWSGRQLPHQSKQPPIAASHACTPARVDERGST